MERTIKIFRSFAEAEEADKEFYSSLTPAQRIEIVLMLRAQHLTADEKVFKRVCRVIKRSDLLTPEQNPNSVERP